MPPYKTKFKNLSIPRCRGNDADFNDENRFSSSRSIEQKIGFNMRCILKISRPMSYENSLLSSYLYIYVNNVILFPCQASYRTLL